jgi:hypothetical protein
MVEDMVTISAEDLRTKRFASIDRILQGTGEVVISVKGKPRYIVTDIATYGYLRECEIAAAWARTKEDLSAGRYRRENADDHLARLLEQVP